MSFAFFETLFPAESKDGRDLGFVALALYPEGRYDPGESAGPTSVRYFSWPSQKEDLVAFCLHNTELDVYTSAALFKQRGSRDVSNIAHQWAVTALAGKLNLRKLRAEPTMIVETSPGVHELYWTTSIDSVERLTDIARAIAHTHADDGCERGGWDAGQLLRVPGTTNNEPTYSGRPPFEVALKGDPGSPYSGLTKLKELYPPNGPQAALLGTAMPEPKKWRSDPQVVEEASRIFNQSPDIHTLYTYKTDPEQRVDVLKRLLTSLSRNGASRLAAMHIAWGARCNTYAENGGAPEALWILLCDIFERPANRPITTSIEAGQRSRIDTSDEDPENQVRRFAAELKIVKDGERANVPTDTFIDRYTEWASTRTDAPDIYHRAGAVTLLTSIFGEFGKCPTRFDTNLTLWFLLLGPTTRARKTTAMMLWVDLLIDLQTEKHTYAPMSDVTSEGLSMILPKRDGKTTVFFRDEAQGLLYELDAKRYFAGLQEHMTELYGGRVRGRVRASSIPSDDDDSSPSGNIRTNFVMFLCGTLDQVTSALTIEDYQSGHLARFLAAEADPPEPTEEEMYVEQYDGDDEEDDLRRISLMNDLARARDFWAQNTRPGRPQRIPFERSAWDRLQKAIYALTEAAKADGAAEALVPTAQRMGISVMKCAILLAMAEQRVRVEMRHVLKALEQSEEWLSSTATIAGRIMHSSWSARQEEVLTMVRSRMDGITQQEIYSRFRTKMHEKQIEEALNMLVKSDEIRRSVDRGRIRYSRSPRT